MFITHLKMQENPLFDAVIVYEDLCGTEEQLKYVFASHLIEYRFEKRWITASQAEADKTGEVVAPSQRDIDI